MGFQQPALEFLAGGVEATGCGQASSAMGPFYCPADQSIYIDTSFYDQLDRKLGAPGDFARYYVIAHEYGHHIQQVTGVADQIRSAQSQNSGGANQLQVRMELQADCYAGVWGHYVAGSKTGIRLEAGDVEEGLAAAAALGDDRLQRQSRGQVSPETWTHGSSAQRVQWLRRGLESGRVSDCDTFRAGS